jgi:hypothetical protein
VFFQVRRKSNRAPASGAVVILDAEGREVARQAFEPGGQKPTAHDLRLPLAGLATGVYTVELRATSGEHAATRRVGIIVNDVR